MDTGFEGSILLPADFYSFFQIGELPKSMWRVYKTLTGTVVMRVARTLAEINSNTLETSVESPILGGKPPIGGEFFNKLVLILDGPQKLCCTTIKTEHSL